MARLGELFTIASGGTPDKKHAEYYENGSIPWVKTGDLKEKYVQDGIECITEQGVKNSSAKLFPPNTVLVAMYGATIGACSILPYEATTNQACAAFLPTPDVLPDYLYYFLCSKKEQFVKDGVGGAQPNISASYLKNVEIQVPSLQEQHVIIATLNRAQELIVLRKQQIAKLDELVKARFVEMFGDPVADSMKWGQLPLSCFLKDIRYGTSTPPSFTNEGYEFIRATNIKNGSITTSDMKYISSDEARKLEKCKVLGGEMIIVRSGVNAGDTCVVSGQHCGQYAGYDMILVFTEELHPVFTNVLINTKYMEKIVKPLTRRAAQPHLNAEQVQSFPIIRVPYELQDQFAAFVAQTDQQKLTIQHSLAKLELLKKALMQKYFG